MGPKQDLKGETDETEDETDEEDIGEGDKREIDLIGKYLGERNAHKEREGKGWAILPNGDQYDGQYSRGQRDGEGLYVFKNGARYKGRYRCGIKSGFGVFYYPDGSKYEGHWRKDFKHGRGTYTYPNGDMYRGNWYKGKRHGMGEYYFAEYDCHFNGTWIDGVRVGPAEVHYKKHALYGTWDDKYPQGPAMYSFHSKYMYKGYYRLLRGKNLSIDMNSQNIAEETRGLAKEIETVDLEGDEDESQKRASTTTVRGALPQWYCQQLLKYEFAMLPQQPVPLPISDSEEDMCDLSLQASPQKMQYGEEKDEQDVQLMQSTVESKTTLSWSNATIPCDSTTPDISQASKYSVTVKTNN